MATFDEQRKDEFLAFLRGERDGFDMHAVDPDEHSWVGSLVAGLTVDSAGGIVPFQAEGSIGARATDGSLVPMRWYYRSRHGWASLSVAMTADECYGSSPLFAAGTECVEFESGPIWTERLVRLAGELEPISFLYWFPTLAVQSEIGAVHPAIAELVDQGLSVLDIVTYWDEHPEQFEGVPRAAAITVLHGRGHSVEAALADARSFKLSEYLVEKGIDEGKQRAIHDFQVAHMDERSFNPYLSEDLTDDRSRPDVELAERPFEVLAPRDWFAQAFPDVETAPDPTA